MRRVAYRLFRSTASFEDRLGRQLTPAGKLVLAALGAATVIGFDTNRTVGYQAFALLAALLGVAAGWSAVFRPRLRVRRALPRFVTAGTPATYRVVIQNEAPRPQRGLVVLEDLADARPSFDEWVRAREPGEERRNWFDRTLGYPRWAWLVERRRGARIAPRPLPPLPARGGCEVEVALLPIRRGRLEFTGVTLARPDPFGLVNALVTVPLPGGLVVLPKRYPVGRLALPGARKYQRGGVALAGTVGDSEEFVSLRDYRAGDPLRRVHWRSAARVGWPVVKEYQDEFFVRDALVLDTFAERVESDLFEEAVSVAASVASSIQTQDSLLDLLFVGPETYCFTTGRGLGHTDYMLEVLAGVRPCLDKPFHALRDAVLERSASLSSAVVILLAWDEPRRDLVRRLRGLGIPTRVLVLGDGPAPASEPGAEVQHLEVGRIAEGLARG